MLLILAGNTVRRAASRGFSASFNFFNIGLNQETRMESEGSLFFSKLEMLTVHASAAMHIVEQCSFLNCVGYLPCDLYNPLFII